jgi:hypothetical protein
MVLGLLYSADEKLADVLFTQSTDAIGRPLAYELFTIRTAVTRHI